MYAASHREAGEWTALSEEALSLTVYSYVGHLMTRQLPSSSLPASSLSRLAILERSLVYRLNSSCGRCFE